MKANVRNMGTERKEKNKNASVTASNHFKSRNISIVTVVVHLLLFFLLSPPSLSLRPFP